MLLWAQAKFNLLAEESEGFAKLIVELAAPFEARVLARTGTRKQAGPLSSAEFAAIERSLQKTLHNVQSLVRKRSVSPFYNANLYFTADWILLVGP